MYLCFSVHRLDFFHQFGGHGRTRDTLTVREVVGELTVRYQRRIAQKSYYTTVFHHPPFHHCTIADFQRHAFPRNFFPQEAFPQNDFPRNAGKAR